MDPIRSLTVTGTDEPHNPITDSAGLDRTEKRHGGRALLGAHPYLLASTAYLLVTLIVWAHLWTGHPTSSTTCGCGDPSATIWYTSWPAYAMSHGLNPLYSTAVGFPTGVNLIFTAYGIVLAPLTWLFGPIAALNVALTVSPVLSALAMFALVRRWVNWMPAAFVAGLFYGFSPFVLANLTVAHIDFGMIALLPLVVIALDELLIRQRRPPVKTGIVLGLLISLQFFVGTEPLIEAMIEIGIGVGLVVIYTAARNRVGLRGHLRRAAVGCGAAALTTLVLLVFPIWYAVAGPAHFSKSIHPSLKLSTFEAPVRAFLFPTPALRSPFFHILGGYQGPVFSQQYFGIGVVLVSLGGLIIWRRDRLLWLFETLALISVVLATLSGSLFASASLLNNIVPSHFLLFAYLTVAIVLGVVVDRVRSAVDRTWRDGFWQTRNRNLSEHRPRSLRRTANVAGLAVAALAVVPPAAYLATGIPFTVEPVVLPTWFRTVAPRLQGHPVVLALPGPFTTTKAGLTWRTRNGQSYLLAVSGKQAAMTWQALGGQRYSIVGPGGLGAGVDHRAGENQGQDVITEVTFAYGSRPNVTTGDIAAVHRALSEWGVTTVVLPDQPALPTYEQVASVTDMAALIAAATGARPVHVAQAWVWQRVDEDLPTAFPVAGEYERCTAGSAGRGAGAVERATACVLATPLHPVSRAAS